MFRFLFPWILALPGVTPAATEFMGLPIESDADDGVVRYAQDALHEQLRSRFTTVEIEPIGRTIDILCARPHFVSRDVASPQALAPRMLVTVRINCADGRAETVAIWFKVKAYASVVVAARDLPVGKKLSKDDIRIEEREMTAIRGSVFPIDGDPTGLHAVVPLRIGAPITAASVRSEPEVIAQEAVLIRIRQGQVNIEVWGLSLQNGRIGDRVQVVNLSSGDTLAAQVTQLRTVEVGP